MKNDLSHKDAQYFIDAKTYNCPFCKRRNIRYFLENFIEFDWSPTKKAYSYIVECTEEDCKKRSMHLSYQSIKVAKAWDGSKFLYHFIATKENEAEIITAYRSRLILGGQAHMLGDVYFESNPDHLFFFHIPTSFFTLDERIPKEIREPLSEAENSLNSNFLTGGSACLRKAIYKFLQHQGIPEKKDSTSDSWKLNERIDLLKGKYPNLDILNDFKQVHGLTSQEVHENDWEDFSGKDLRFLIELVKEILNEIYVSPDDKTKRRAWLNKLSSDSKK